MTLVTAAENLHHGPQVHHDPRHRSGENQSVVIANRGDEGHVIHRVRCLDFLQGGSGRNFPRITPVIIEMRFAVVNQKIDEILICLLLSF
jgi:hypothetical protein